MTDTADWPLLLDVFRDAGLDRVLGSNRDVVLSRLGDVRGCHARTLAGLPREAQVPVPTVAELVREYQRNPHRVAPVLQALAYNCSPPMLAMMWMVQMGARVDAVDYKFERGQLSRLSVKLELPDRASYVEFESTEHWDLAVLRLAGISKGDGLPLIESFYALR